MNSWIWCIFVIFIILIMILLIKIYYLKKATKEIKKAFIEKAEQNTNTLIAISSHDKDMKALAQTINSQLFVFHQKRQKYEHGDYELKEAITNISHDLRTPLTAIIGYIRLLKNEELSNTGTIYLNSIEERTNTLKQLMEELFHYTIVSSDTENFSMEMVNINGVLKQCISSFYAQFIQLNIIPEISITNQKVERMLNEKALFRILGNIISNAIKYSDGDLMISLSEDGSICFSNHAADLTKIQVAKLFDRFYTVNNARKSTGLGLSIAKSLTEKMNGKIYASYRDNVLTICIKF